MISKAMIVVSLNDDIFPLLFLTYKKMITIKTYIKSCYGHCFIRQTLQSFPASFPDINHPLP